MSKIKVSELFYSLQGEGRHTGAPSVFLRTFGCNFTCQGFGMEKGKLSEERLAINGEAYSKYTDLPLVTTGCDSYASWDPRFKHLSPVLTSNAIVDSILEMLPHKRWMDEHLVITGGEPLLGWQRSYPDLLMHPMMQSLKELTFETNGTQPISGDFEKFLLEEWLMDRGYDDLTFSVSPKLSISGEKWSEAIRPEVVASYSELGHTYLKFVIATEEDADEAEQAVDEYRKAGWDGQVYLMPCGGVESVYSLNNRRVADLALRKGWKYSDRLQVPLFKNEWGT